MMEFTAEQIAQWVEIHMACKKGDVETIRLIASLGADISGLGYGGFTHLETAVTYGQIEVVRLLIELGVDINMARDDGTTATMKLCYSSEGLEIVKLLVENGVNLNARRDDGMTILALCVYFKRDDLVSYLLDNWADPTIRDDVGRTALDVAISKHLTKIADCLRVGTEKWRTRVANENWRLVYRTIQMHNFIRRLKTIIYAPGGCLFVKARDRFVENLSSTKLDT